MKGMQDNGVLVCVKYFLGYGDIDVDLYYDLLVIFYDFCCLDSIELYLFWVLVDQGVGSVMVVYLQVFVLESWENFFIFFFLVVINGVFCIELDFYGFIFIDGLEMKGVIKYFGNGDVEVIVLLVGNDILLLLESLVNVEVKIKEYICDNCFLEVDINCKVKWVLWVKY